MKELLYYHDLKKEARQEGKEEGREEGRLEGKEEGRLEGRREGKQEIKRLNQYLAGKNRIDDMIRAARDEAYQKKLLEEFHNYEAGGV